MQKARRHPCPHLREDIGLRLLVSIRFQVLFHSPPGVLFTFPSRYWFTIGHQRVFSLGGGPPGFPQGFTCPVVLGIPDPGVLSLYAYGTITLYGAPFQTLQLCLDFLLPVPTAIGTGLAP